MQPTFLGTASRPQLIQAAATRLFHSPKTTGRPEASAGVGSSRKRCGWVPAAAHRVPRTVLWNMCSTQRGLRDSTGTFAPACTVCGRGLVALTTTTGSVRWLAPRSASPNVCVFLIEGSGEWGVPVSDQVSIWFAFGSTLSCVPPSRCLRAYFSRACVLVLLANCNLIILYIFIRDAAPLPLLPRRRGRGHFLRQLGRQRPDWGLSELI